MYKMMVSDLDETLLCDDGTISDENILAIKKSVAQGFKFIPNTGRGFMSVQPLLQQLALNDCPAQFVIAYNGAVIIENRDNHVISTQGMEFELAQKILTTGLIDATIDAHVYTLNKVYVYNISSADKKYLAQRGVTYQIFSTPKIDFLTNEPIMKVIFETSDDTLRQQIKAAVCKQFAQEVEATFSSKRYIEFNKRGTNKGAATKLLAEKLNVLPDEIIAIGDSTNDLAMIKFAGLGVAVANALPEVKMQAQKIMPYTNNEGVVAKTLEEFVLAPK